MYETNDLNQAAAIRYLLPDAYRGLEKRLDKGKFKGFFQFDSDVVDVVKSDTFTPFRMFFNVRNEMKKDLRKLL